MSDLWYDDYVPSERTDNLKQQYIMPSVGEVHGPDEAVDVEGIADWTSLQDAWGTSSFENRAFDPHATRAPVEAYDALGGGLGGGGFGSSYEPSGTDGAVGGANRSYGGAGTYGQSGAFGSYGANSGSGQALTSAPSYGSYTNGPTAPSYTNGPQAPSYTTGPLAPQAPQAPPRAGAYSLDGIYDENRVSCSSCNWTLEDKSWCCDRNCNDPNGGHFRQAYVCADPSDPTGKLTSRCEVETECLADQPPLLCSAESLRAMQRGDTRDDPSCASWRASRPTQRPTQTAMSGATSAPTYWPTSGSASPYATPYATGNTSTANSSATPSQWPSHAPSQWPSSAPSQWPSSASYAPTSTASQATPRYWPTPVPTPVPTSAQSSAPYGTPYGAPYGTAATPYGTPSRSAAPSYSPTAPWLGSA